MRRYKPLVIELMLTSMLVTLCSVPTRNEPLTPVLPKPTYEMEFQWSVDSEPLPKQENTQSDISEIVDAEEIVIPDGVKESDYIPDPSIIREYILEHQQDPLELLIDLAQENQTMTIGESHDNINAKKFVADSLNDLVKEGGFDFLAVELHSIYQKDIDRYMSGWMSAKKLEEKIPYLFNGCSIDMLDKAREAGIPVLAIDTDAHTDRDDYMFNQLQERVFKDNPDAKVLVYIGNAHTTESEMGSYDRLSLGAHLEDYTKGENASVRIVFPRYVNWFIVEVEDVPDMIGFRTDYEPLSDMRYGGDTSGFPSLDVYYGLDMDGMIVIDY